MGRPKTISDAALLAIAREVFVRAGGAGSTKEIARRAGLSEAAIFKRYTTKAALFLAAMAPPRLDVAALATRISVITDPQRGLIDIGVEVLTYLRAALPVVLPLLTNPAIGPDAVRDNLADEQMAALLRSISSYVRQQRRAGRVARTAEPVAVATVLFGCIHNVALIETLGGRHAGPAAAVVRPVVAMLWHGLRPTFPDPSTRGVKP